MYGSHLAAVDPSATGEGRLPGSRAGHLGELFTAAGLTDVEQTELEVSVHYATFDEIRLTEPPPSREVQRVTWRIELGPDQRREDETTERLVEHNQKASAAIRQRFEPENLPARPVAAYAVDDDGELLGGCVGSTVDVWQWLTVDMMWVHPSHRGKGLGRRLLAAVEDQARERGCRWAKLNTWEFQAPEFYARCGYATYGRETDFPPGHTNHLMRKDL